MGNQVRDILVDNTGYTVSQDFHIYDGHNTKVAKYYASTTSLPYISDMRVSERYLYGSERLGVIKGPNMISTWSTAPKVIDRSWDTHYELHDHLGNVRATFSSQPIAMYGGTVTPTTTVRTENYYHYYAFGSPHPNRYYEPSGAHHWGFNSKERKDDFRGIGNSYDYGARHYDARIGRWGSVDPSFTKNPWLSPYSFVENSPIYYKDPDGKDAVVSIKGNTITISATIFVVSDKTNKSAANRIHDDIMSVWGGKKSFTAANGKSYNVKFEVNVVAIAAEKLPGKILDRTAGRNYIILAKDEGQRSYVQNGQFGIWRENAQKGTYAHEFGHLVGLDDQYYDTYTYDKKSKCYKVTGSEPYASKSGDDIMASGTTGKKEVKGDIEAIGNYIVEKFGLLKEGVKDGILGILSIAIPILNGPTGNDKVSATPPPVNICNEKINGKY